MADSTNIIQSIKRRYITGLAIIGLSACASFICLRLALMRSETTALIVNISGRQRMLSQHIALDALKILNAETVNSSQSPKDILTNIAIHSKEMQLSNKKLSSGDLSRTRRASPSEAARKIYFGETNLSQRVSRFTDLGAELVNTKNREKIELIAQKIISTSPNLLKDLDRVVNLYQKEGEEKLALTEKLELGIISITLILLIAEAKFIFYPIIQLVKESKKSESKRIDDLMEQVELRTLKLEKSNLRLRELALHDQLTGLKNRSCLVDDISMIVNAFNKNQCDFGVAYIDIDWFKKVNDEFGHEFGDFVLKEFAKLASSQLRDSDSFYRIGGEEFVILFMRGNLDGICQKIESIRNTIEKHYFVSGENSHAITLSIGLFHSSKYLGAELNADKILQLADDALYFSKSNGRNQLTLSSS